MINIKSFLSLKKISDISEMNIGDVCLLNDKILLKNADGYFKTISFSDENYFEFIIYGIRVPVQGLLSIMTDETIERVIIKRKIMPNGEIIDNELVGDDCYLDFTKSVDTFSDLHPFNGMNKEERTIASRTGNLLYGFVSSTNESNRWNDYYTKKAYFTRLPLFYKNKEKTRTVNGIKYDYYLISDVYWDDFYPVESHLKDNGEYASSIWIESDWHVADLSSFGNPRSKYFLGDFILNDNNDDIPTYCINSLVWYDYLYYLFMIKTASFKPFLNPEKWDFDVSKAYNFIYDDQNTNNYKQLQTNSDYIQVQQGEQLDLTVTFTYTTSTYVRLNLTSPLFSTHMEYLQKLKNDLSKFNHCLVLQDKNNVIFVYACVELLGSGSSGDTILLKMNCPRFYTRSEFESSNYYNRTFHVVLIKSIPYNSDITYRNSEKTYFEEHRFCVDNISNIFPVFFKPFYFNESNNANELSIFNATVQTASSLNYDTFIDCGFRSSWLNSSTSKKRNIFGSSVNYDNIPLTKLNIPFFNGICSEFEISSTIESGMGIYSVVNYDNNKIKMINLKNGIINSSYLDNTNFVARGNLGGMFCTNRSNTVCYNNKYFNEYLLYIGIYNENYVYKNNGNTTVSVPSFIYFGWNNISLMKNGYHVSNLVDNTNSSISAKDLYTVTRFMYFD